MQFCVSLRVKKRWDNICLTDMAEHNVEQNIVILGGNERGQDPGCMIICFVDRGDRGDRSLNISPLTFISS